MSIAIGNVPHVARPNTMRNHLMVLTMKTFTALMLHLSALLRQEGPASPWKKAAL
jgi:hypothetical protein